MALGRATTILLMLTCVDRGGKGMQRSRVVDSWGGRGNIIRISFGIDDSWPQALTFTTRTGGSVGHDLCFGSEKGKN